MVKLENLVLSTFVGLVSIGLAGTVQAEQSKNETEIIYQQTSKADYPVAIRNKRTGEVTPVYNPELDPTRQPRGTVTNAEPQQPQQPLPKTEYGWARLFFNQGDYCNASNSMIKVLAQYSGRTIPEDVRKLAITTGKRCVRQNLKRYDVPDQSPHGLRLLDNLAQRDIGDWETYAMLATYWTNEAQPFVDKALALNRERAIDYFKTHMAQCSLRKYRINELR